MKDKYILISSISFPVVAAILAFIIVNYEHRPNIESSVLRRAIHMQENRSHNPSSAILASELFESTTSAEQKIDRTKLSFLQKYQDKLSVPQFQLAQILPELEISHQKMLKDYRLQNKKINSILLLSPRYHIVLAAHLEVDPGLLTNNHIKNSELTGEEIYFLKTLSKSDDLVILLKKNLLNNDYVNVENLRNIYGNNHHLDSKLDRSISGSK